MLEVPKALDTILYINKHIYILLVTILTDVTMDNQQETKVIF